MNCGRKVANSEKKRVMYGVKEVKLEDVIWESEERSNSIASDKRITTIRIVEEVCTWVEGGIRTSIVTTHPITRKLTTIFIGSAR